MMPLVSIIIQTFNRCKLVKRAIESSINQTYTNIEIIIADNHSEDETEALCKEFENTDKRIRYFRHDKNIGMVANGNFGLSQIKGEYYIFLNDDDWLDENYVKESVEFLESHPDYSFCSPQTVLHEPNSENKRVMRAPILDVDNINERILNYIKSQDDSMVSSGCFRTSVLRQMQSLKENVHKNRYNEDIVFIIKYVCAGKGKVLTNTFYNKTDCGTTMKIETTREDIYTTKWLNKHNIPIIRAKNFSSSLLDDKFYNLCFSKRQRKQIAKTIFDEIVCWGYKRSNFNEVLPIYWLEIYQYVKKHSLFMFRGEFIERCRNLLFIAIPYIKMKIKIALYF